MVSTDDNEIAEIAKKYGAEVPFLRSPETSDDFASTLDVVIEVINQYKTRNQNFDHICCIYPTAPLLKTEHLKKGYDKMIKGGYDSVFPVVAFSYPIWRGLRIKDDKTTMLWDKYLNSRSQDLEPVYHDAGQWYWLKTTKIKNSLWTDNTSSIILSETEVQDIDNETDWKLAEIKYKFLQNK